MIRWLFFVVTFYPWRSLIVRYSHFYLVLVFLEISWFFWGDFADMWTARGKQKNSSLIRLVLENIFHYDVMVIWELWFQTHFWVIYRGTESLHGLHGGGHFGLRNSVCLPKGIFVFGSLLIFLIFFNKFENIRWKFLRVRNFYHYFVLKQFQKVTLRATDRIT